MNPGPVRDVRTDVSVPACVVIMALGGGAALLGRIHDVAYLGSLSPAAPWQVVAGIQVVLAALVVPQGIGSRRARDLWLLCLVGLPLEALTMAGGTGWIDGQVLVALRVLLAAQVAVAWLARRCLSRGLLSSGEAVLGGAVILGALPVCAAILGDAGWRGEPLAALSPLHPVLDPGSGLVQALLGQAVLALGLALVCWWRSRP